MTSEWRDFELAVAKFLSSLDPKAQVIHDYRTHDIHTKTLRQRDIWINAKICAFIPVSIIVSCKRLKRSLNQQDIDAIHGEFISSGANISVVYSYSGFNANAIRKARALNITCCQLYVDQPADIPERLIFADSYCCAPKVSLSIAGPIFDGWMITSWNDVFMLSAGEEKLSYIDIIVQACKEGEKASLPRAANGEVFPKNWARVIKFMKQDVGDEALYVVVRGYWVIYQGMLEACLINGTYNITNEQFVGQQSTPSIDRFSVHPGPGWRKLDYVPSDEVPPGKTKVVIILHGGNVRESMIEQLSEKRVTMEHVDLNSIIGASP